MKNLGFKTIGAAWLAMILTANSAMAISYGFVNITGGTPDVADQLSVTVTDHGNQQVLFDFYNSGPIDSTIGEIYFDDGPLLGIASINNGAGVNFTTGGSNGVNPSNLPGGENLIPAFEATRLFSTESDGKNSAGVDVGETVGILFDLVNNKTYDDIIQALEDGSLRIGMHVRSIGPEGISDSFVNNGLTQVPDAASSAMLLGIALLAIERYRRKRI